MEGGPRSLVDYLNCQTAIQIMPKGQSEGDGMLAKDTFSLISLLTSNFTVSLASEVAWCLNCK